MLLTASGSPAQTLPLLCSLLLPPSSSPPDLLGLCLNPASWDTSVPIPGTHSMHGSVPQGSPWEPHWHSPSLTLVVPEVVGQEPKCGQGQGVTL